jgi:uncharacterized membrane protein YidH (DUF202 family)
VTPAEAPLATERTALSWQRTALSLLAGSLILARLTFDRLGALAILGVVVTVVLASWVLWESRTRYHRGGISRPVRGGRAGLALASAMSVLALVELAALLTG